MTSPLFSKSSPIIPAQLESYEYHGKGRSVKFILVMLTHILISITSPGSCYFACVLGCTLLKVVGDMRLPACSTLEGLSVVNLIVLRSPVVRFLHHFGEYDVLKCDVNRIFLKHECPSWHSERVSSCVSSLLLTETCDIDVDGY